MWRPIVVQRDRVIYGRKDSSMSASRMEYLGFRPYVFPSGARDVVRLVREVQTVQITCGSTRRWCVLRRLGVQRPLSTVTLQGIPAE